MGVKTSQPNPRPKACLNEERLSALYCEEGTLIYSVSPPPRFLKQICDHLLEGCTLRVIIRLLCDWWTMALCRHKFLEKLSLDLLERKSTDL